MERTEALLVADLLEGDTTALASIVEKYGKLVYRLAIQITKNHEDANDVMQETLPEGVRINRGLPKGIRF